MYNFLCLYLCMYLYLYCTVFAFVLLSVFVLDKEGFWAQRASTGERGDGLEARQVEVSVTTESKSPLQAGHDRGLHGISYHYGERF